MSSRAKAVAAYVDIARRHNLDPAQMALAFVRRQPFVASTLLGATTLEQLKTNVESLHLELSEAVLAEVKRCIRSIPTRHRKRHPPG